jgi:hypothetical protein
MMDPSETQETVMIPIPYKYNRQFNPEMNLIIRITGLRNYIQYHRTDGWIRMRNSLVTIKKAHKCTNPDTQYTEFTQ